MIEFIALNLAPIIFVSLVVFLLLGYPVSTAFTSAIWPAIAAAFDPTSGSLWRFSE